MDTLDTFLVTHGHLGHILNNTHTEGTFWLTHGHLNICWVTHGHLGHFLGDTWWSTNRGPTYPGEEFLALIETVKQ